MKQWTEWCLEFQFQLLDLPENISFMQFIVSQLWPWVRDACRTSPFFMWVCSNVMWNVPKFVRFILATFPMVLSILLTSSNFVPCLRILCCGHHHHHMVWIWNPPWFHLSSTFSIFYKLIKTEAEICCYDLEGVTGMGKSFK